MSGDGYYVERPGPGGKPQRWWMPHLPERQRRKHYKTGKAALELAAQKREARKRKKAR